MNIYVYMYIYYFYLFCGGKTGGVMTEQKFLGINYSEVCIVPVCTILEQYILAYPLFLRKRIFEEKKL